MAESGTVVVQRTAPHDVMERELYVSIDGGPNEILRFGDTARIAVAPGHHRIRVHNTWKRRFAEFDMEAGKEVRFKAANVPGKGYQFMAVFFGFAFMNTELEREPDSVADARLPSSQPTPVR